MFRASSSIGITPAVNSGAGILPVLSNGPNNIRLGRRRIDKLRSPFDPTDKEKILRDHQIRPETPAAAEAVNPDLLRQIQNR
jgi:hypothetical protein